MATPETPKTPEVPELYQELEELKINVSKDNEKFETLSKNPVLKNGLNKLYNKSYEKVFSEEWKHFEKLHIGGTLQKILKKYPNLLLYITGNLGLSLEEKSFSKLSLNQKLNFTALYQAVTANGLFDKKNVTPQDILERVKKNTKLNMDKINRNFERKNIKNFLDLEKTLKDFGLNSDEIGKIKEYLLIIKKHPEFVGINKPIEAGREWIGYLIFMGIGAALGWLGKYYIDNLGKIEQETTIDLTVPEVVTVENPESVLKFMVTKGKFGNNPEHPIRGREEIKMFTINDNDAWWKKWAKEKLNIIQSREIIMDLSGDVLGGFDLDKGCQIDIEENYPTKGKGIAYVQLPEPDVMILNDEAKVVSEKLERVHLSEFKNAQEQLRLKLRAQAENGIKKDDDFYNKIKEDAKNNLLKLFKSMKPYGMEIEEVKIRFFDPKKGEKPIKIDSHQPLTTYKD